MILDLNEELKVEIKNGRKFERGSKIDPLGFCSNYLFANKPSCVCHNRYWLKKDLGKICPDCEHEILINNGVAYSYLSDWIVNPTIWNMLPNKEEFSYTSLNESPKEYILKFVEKDVELVKFLSDLKETQIVVKKIPVINYRFRIDGRGSIDKLNVYYGALLQTIESYNNTPVKELTREVVLAGIQKLWGKINKYLIDLKTERKGFSPYLSFSGRCPILPQSVEKSFEGVTLGFEIFRKIFKFRIVHYIKKYSGKELLECIKLYDEMKYGDELFNLIKNDLTRESMMIINRNPSLYINSLIAVKLNDIKPGFTMEIPLILYKVLGADNDGDTMAIIPLFTKEAREKAWSTLGVPAILGSISNSAELELDSVFLLPKSPKIDCPREEKLKN